METERSEVDIEGFNKTFSILGEAVAKRGRAVLLKRSLSGREAVTDFWLYRISNFSGTEPSEGFIRIMSSIARIEF